MERALIAVVESNGNVRAASDMLALDDIEINYGLLSNWIKKTHRTRYESIQAEMGPRIRKEAAQAQRAVAEKARGVTEKILDKLDREVEGMDTRDLPGAARNLATVGAISIDKAMILDGEPTARVEHNIIGTVKELETLGVTVDFIEGSAEEISTPALSESKTDER